MHWSTKYIGLRYNREHFDCLDFAVEVARVELNLNIDSPPHINRPQGSRERASMILSECLDYAERVSTPVEGHPIILFSNNHPSHIGVAAYVDGCWQCLHNTRGNGVICQPISRIERDFKTGIEGFYRWIH